VVARLVPVARAAAAVGARLRLRAADAARVAAPARLRLPLVTWGLEQREHATGIVDVLAPGPWPSRP